MRKKRSNSETWMSFMFMVAAILSLSNAGLFFSNARLRTELLDLKLTHESEIIQLTQQLQVSGKAISELSDISDRRQAEIEDLTFLLSEREKTSERSISPPQTDLERLACVIYQEAGGNAQSNDTRVMVGNVVMNRVASDKFPNTIEEVLLQERQYGEMHWKGIVWPDRAENEPEAVQRAYECAELVLGGERLLTEDYIWQAEFPQGTDWIFQDEIYFGRD